MRKSDGKPYSVLQACVQQVQSKMITKGGPSKKSVAPVFSGQPPGWHRWASDPYLQDVSNGNGSIVHMSCSEPYENDEPSIWNYRCLDSSQVEERDNRVY